MLAVAGTKGVSRDKLLGVLWPESETEKGRHALNQILSAQRRHFSNTHLFEGNKTVRLNPAAITSDVVEFHEAIAEGNTSRALELYSGPFLDGFFLQGTSEFESWASDQRARLVNLLVDALDSAARRAHDSVDSDNEIKWQRHALDLDRTNARRAVRLATTMANGGNRTGALRVLHDCQKRIRDELGISGDSEIRRTIEELVRE